MNEPQKKFGAVFRERVASIEARAKAVGLNWTSICDLSGVSRATPDRWKRNYPKTIEVIEQLEAVVDEAEAAVKK